MRNTIFAVVLAISIIGFGYPEQSAKGRDSDNAANLSPESWLAASCNRFGLELFQETARSGEPNANIVVSPVSAVYALGMIYNAAGGETKKKIAHVLRADEQSNEEINDAFRTLNEILAQADPKVNFNPARSAWFREGKPIRPQFIDACSTYFDAGTRSIDFRAPSAADTINGWVNRSTGGRITSMVTAPLDERYAMIVLNAAYFHAGWTFPFDSAATSPWQFRRGDGSQTECRMMFSGEDDHLVRNDEGNFVNDSDATYFENNLFQAAGLPYGDRRFRMTVMVPDTLVSIDSLVASMTPENWPLWRSGFRASKFIVGLPKFRVRCERDMMKPLGSLGLADIFDPNQCDLSGAFADGIGWIDDVRQKSFIRVDEKGTEAVDVSDYVASDSVTPFVLADRPFLFVIDEKISGVILFVGKIADPVF